MVEVDEGDAHILRDEFEVVVVEGTHLATLVLALAEELPLCVFECTLKEQLLVLIRTLLPLLGAALHVLQHHAVLLVQLL